jgi:translation initiation factor 1 (eIF-1/SUI1)
MAHFQLTDFAIWSKSNGNTVVLVSKHKRYLELLIESFPSMNFSHIWEDVFNKYDWGVFINQINDDQRERVKKLLELFQSVVCIEDVLSQSFALAYHMKPDYYEGGRSDIGELVFHAKYRNNQQYALELVNKFQNFIQCHPNYQKSNFLIYVPYYGSRSFSLPQYLAEELCNRFGFPSDAQQYVTKIKETQAMKDLTNEEKFENIRGCFQIHADAPFAGKVVTIIDDLYQSGTTLHELATTLQKTGATVQGLVATKTIRN